MLSRDAAAKMVIERDLQIPMDDGLVLRTDVYRPKTDAPVPVIMTLGPYGKGVMYQDHYKAMWDWLIAQHPDLLPGSTRSFMAWETVDPETWVPWGYAVVRVDSRGACRSPGMLDIFSPRETLDYYHAIEWAGTRSWSNGKVGLNGISYYAINQWHVAQLQPPHLTAMVPWEGAADMYRDWYRHGGILSNKFMEVWYPRQVLQVQHGNPKAPRDHWMNESAAGPEQMSPEELPPTASTTSPTRERERWMTNGTATSRRTGRRSMCRSSAPPTGLASACTRAETSRRSPRRRRSRSGWRDPPAATKNGSTCRMAWRCRSGSSIISSRASKMGGTRSRVCG